MEINFSELTNLFEEYRDTGSSLSYEKLYTLTYPKMLQIAYTSCGNQAMAEDAVQDMFIRLEEYKDRIRDSAYIYCWMSRTVHNCARKLATDANREITNIEGNLPETSRIIAENVYGPESHYALVRDIIYESLKELSPELRKFVMLRYIHGFTAVEIAEMTGYNYRTAARRVVSGLRELRKVVERKYGTLYDIF